MFGRIIVELYPLSWRLNDGEGSSSSFIEPATLHPGLVAMLLMLEVKERRSERCEIGSRIIITTFFINRALLASTAPPTSNRSLRPISRTSLSCRYCVLELQMVVRRLELAISNVQGDARGDKKKTAHHRPSSYHHSNTTQRRACSNEGVPLATAHPVSLTCRVLSERFQHQRRWNPV